MFLYSFLPLFPNNRGKLSSMSPNLEIDLKFQTKNGTQNRLGVVTNISEISFTSIFFWEELCIFFDSSRNISSYVTELFSFQMYTWYVFISLIGDKTTGGVKSFSHIMIKSLNSKYWTLFIINITYLLGWWHHPSFLILLIFFLLFYLFIT